MQIDSKPGANKYKLKRQLKVYLNYMIRRKKIRRALPKERYTINRQIRFPEVRVLSERGEQLGVMPTQEALDKAQDQEKDLILITESAKPPVAKIISLDKFKYQQQQRKAEDRKKARKQDTKEVRFTPFIGENDFQVRLKKVRQFLEKGDKVRLTIEFRRGRQITKKEFGFETFERVIEATQEIATVEIPPKMMGKKMMAQLNPTTKKKPTVNSENN